MIHGTSTLYGTNIRLIVVFVSLQYFTLPVELIVRVKRGYFFRKNDKKYTTKIQGSIDPRAMIKTRNFITVVGFAGIIHR